VAQEVRVHVAANLCPFGGDADQVVDARLLQRLVLAVGTPMKGPEDARVSVLGWERLKVPLKTAKQRWRHWNAPLAPPLSLDVQCGPSTGSHDVSPTKASQLAKSKTTVPKETDDEPVALSWGRKLQLRDLVAAKHFSTKVRELGELRLRQYILSFCKRASRTATPAHQEQPHVVIGLSLPQGRG
jgi:hypothetical protein